VTYTTKRELNDIYRKFENEVRRNPLLDTSVRELVEMYIKSRRTLGVEATTIRGYETAAQRIYSHFEGIDASKVTSYMLQDFVSALSEKYKSKTVRNTVSLMSSSYDNAVKLGQLEKNPCKFVTLPKKEDTKIDLFTEEEIHRFLIALNDERIDFKVAYELALFCGLRRSEILGLKESDVNITFKCVTVSKTRHSIDGKDVVQGTKTEKSHRTLAVPDFVIEDINTLIESHRCLRFEHTDYLIQDGFGKPLGPSNLTQHLARLEEKAILPNVSLHDLRHTFASMLNNAGVDIAMISRELGHSNLTTTLNVYTHVFGNITDSSRGIADSLNEKFDKTRDSATFVPLEEKEKTAEA
jgi:integrase